MDRRFNGDVGELRVFKSEKNVGSLECGEGAAGPAVGESREIRGDAARRSIDVFRNAFGNLNKVELGREGME